jgi:hypothetical protein
MQGFLFSKPVPPEEIPGLLRPALSVSPPLQPLQESVPAEANANGLPTEA